MKHLTISDSLLHKLNEKMLLLLEVWCRAVLQTQFCTGDDPRPLAGHWQAVWLMAQQDRKKAKEDKIKSLERESDEKKFGCSHQLCMFCQLSTWCCLTDVKFFVFARTRCNDRQTRFVNDRCAKFHVCQDKQHWILCFFLACFVKLSVWFCLMNLSGDDETQTNKIWQ